MTAVQIEPFPDNWVYLKVELSCLERMLMVAIARQRKDKKAVDRVAQSQADLVTSHWWKGLIVMEGGGAYDDRKPPDPTKGGDGGGNLQQQLEARIQASQSRDIMLGLPWLRDRLQLTLFEKNLLLLSLAPEVNRRYARLYQYLHTGEGTANFLAIDTKGGKSSNLQINAVNCPALTDLPTIDLALRLLCRNDAEWRAAYQLLVGTSPLVKFGLIKQVRGVEDTFLTSRLKICPTLVNYLLADKPDPALLETLLQNKPVVASPMPRPVKHHQFLQQLTPTINFAQMVLPASLFDDLQHLTHRRQHYNSVTQLWQEPSCQPSPGTIAMFTGRSGTGKTMAAQAIAQALSLPLTWVDLATLDPVDYPDLIQAIQTQAPQILLIKSAQRWLGKCHTLNSATIHRWLVDRRSQPTLTIFATQQQAAITAFWQHQMDCILPFPHPDLATRTQLWQKLIPAQILVDPNLDWTSLARRFSLTGGEIQTAIHTATFYAMAEGEANPDQPITLTLDQILRAVRQQPRFR